MKRWNELLEGIKEETPANSASGGAIAGLGDEPPVRKKKRKKFAGSPIFSVKEEEYMKCFHGRDKHERWSKKFDMNEFENSEIRRYAHRNPGKSIVLQNEKTGEMIYLRRF
tara:strand:- start:189 stop:521 length:333 start_codon:yes stop_codon:yes gene_type:complete